MNCRLFLSWEGNGGWRAGTGAAQENGDGGLAAGCPVSGDSSPQGGFAPLFLLA